MLELVAIAILGGGALLFGLAFRRASARTRAELEALHRAHQQALRQLADEDPDWELTPGKGPRQWAALTARRSGLALRLFAGADLGKTTFIRYRTRLNLRPLGGSFRLPPAVSRLDLPFEQPGVAPIPLAGLGPDEKTVAELSELAASLRLSGDELELVARPGGDPVQRYSYGLHLLLIPAALVRLTQLGQRVGEMLQQEPQNDEAQARR